MEIVIMGKKNPKNLKNFTKEGRIVYVLQSVSLTIFSKRRGHFEINRGFSIKLSKYITIKIHRTHKIFLVVHISAKSNQ